MFTRVIGKTIRKTAKGNTFIILLMKSTMVNGSKEKNVERVRPFMLTVTSTWDNSIKAKGTDLE
jgi:hypothetical protein